MGEGLIMSEHPKDVVVIGGGPAGLAAAAGAQEEGARVLLIERNEELGGILNQCIHDGFGLYSFGEALTGPEFAARYIERVCTGNAEIMLNTLVTSLNEKLEMVYSRRGERRFVRGRSVVLAMGCRERTRGMIRIPGDRGAGVYTAGTAQYLINEANIMVGRNVVILGSGDVGLIMARRLTWEGANVIAVLEKLPYHCGLTRNVKQCLEDYSIPLYLSHTVSRIHGRGRVEAVTVTRVDRDGRSIPGAEFSLECDTLLCSVGLIPENELSRKAGVVLDARTGGAVVGADLMTEIPGLFSCGNVLHIHDVADLAAIEGEQAGRNAARYAAGGNARIPSEEMALVKAGRGVRYVMPQRAPIRGEGLRCLFRVSEPGADRSITVLAGKEKILEKGGRKVHPAEMIHVDIPRYRIADGESLEVRVE